MRAHVCLDFDGVLAYYTEWKGEDHIGEPIEEGIKLARKLYDAGCYIIISTCRTNKTMNSKTGVDTKQMIERIIVWLAEHMVPYHELAIDLGKPWAHAYVDDRAVHFKPNKGTADEVFLEVLRVVNLHDDKVEYGVD